MVLKQQNIDIFQNNIDRYFPEPDLPAVILSQEYVDDIIESLPELPEIKRRRYEQMGLSMQDVLFLANDKNVSSLWLCTD